MSVLGEVKLQSSPQKFPGPLIIRKGLLSSLGGLLNIHLLPLLLLIRESRNHRISKVNIYNLSLVSMGAREVTGFVMYSLTLLSCMYLNFFFNWLNLFRWVSLLHPSCRQVQVQAWSGQGQEWQRERQGPELPGVSYSFTEAQEKAIARESRVRSYCMT